MSAVAPRSRLSPFARAPEFADWLILTAIVLVAVAAAFPLAWMALTSLKTPAETMRTPPVWIPATPSLDAYAKVSDVVQAGRSFLNSAIIATVTTFGILLTSLLAGFAFAKYEFRGRDIIFAVVIATMFLPPIVTLIPLYRLVGYLRIDGGLVGRHRAEPRQRFRHLPDAPVYQGRPGRSDRRRANGRRVGAQDRLLDRRAERDAGDRRAGVIRLRLSLEQLSVAADGARRDTPTSIRSSSA